MSLAGMYIVSYAGLSEKHRAGAQHVGVAVLVVILHAALLYALWRARADNLPATEPVFVCDP